MKRLPSWLHRVGVVTATNATSHGAEGLGSEMDLPPQPWQSAGCCWAGFEAETIHRRQRQANVSAPPGDVVMRRRAAFHEPADERHIWKRNKTRRWDAAGPDDPKVPITPTAVWLAAVDCGINLESPAFQRFSTQDLGLNLGFLSYAGPCRMTTAPQWGERGQLGSMVCDARNVSSQRRKLNVKES
jgi:hypothetical protein